MTSSPARIEVAFAATGTVKVALDLLWLGVIARPIYRRGSGPLLADPPLLPAALNRFAR